VKPARLQSLRLDQWFGISAALLVLVALIGIVAGVTSMQRLAAARELLVDRLDPAAMAGLRLDAAMADENTGIRGYLLTGREAFLDPYRSGRGEQVEAQADLTRLASGADVEELRRDIGLADRAIAEWVRDYAEPTISQVSRGGHVQPSDEQLSAGTARFDRVRVALGGLRVHLMTAREDARERLDAAASRVRTIFVGFGVLLLLSVLAAVATLQAAAVRPLARLVHQVRRVARGDFDRTVEVVGARDVVQLGRDIDRMRQRILAEAAELQRSNAELEQFAYVASHDLQEPLRKVASFCQLLEQRYGGQLDERADQYIGFAVDGARRMQELINDLLAFSRVGRAEKPLTPVDCDAVVRSARANLTALIEETGATVDVGPLPVVNGDPGLLSLVFQNLIGNALKFRGEAPPRVSISASPDGDAWEFTCRDNGIGIDDEYGERIFVIFQRLHSRAAYEGTGIGLAMCRKIVEHHGGRIWLATDGDRASGSGSTFRFTLPRNAQEAHA
jgi:signal transduction histidine kinase